MQSILHIQATRPTFLEILPIPTQVLISKSVVRELVAYMVCPFLGTSEVENDEVVDDPFVSSDLPKFPKKASLKALLEEDPRVIANAIEDERINDIYFTSKSHSYTTFQILRS